MTISVQHVYFKEYLGCQLTLWEMVQKKTQ